MQRKAVSVAVLLAILAAGAAGICWLWKQHRTPVLVIGVSSPTPVAFRGSCEVDGKTRDLSGTTPATFTVDGRRFLYRFEPAESTGEVSVSVDVDGNARGAVGPQPPNKGVRGWAFIDGSTREDWIEAFDPANPGRWINPPRSGEIERR